MSNCRQIVLMFLFVQTPARRSTSSALVLNGTSTSLSPMDQVAEWGATTESALKHLCIQFRSMESLLSSAMLDKSLLSSSAAKLSWCWCLR